MNEVTNYQITWANPDTKLEVRDPDLTITSVYAESRDEAISKFLTRNYNAIIIEILP